MPPAFRIAQTYRPTLRSLVASNRPIAGLGVSDDQSRRRPRPLIEAFHDRRLWPIRHTRSVSPITTTQQGFIAEREFMKLLMLGSEGALEVLAPVTDDERRDLETHIRGQFTPGFIFQVKSTTYLDRRFKARRLSIHFPVAKDRLISHPLFWYFFGYLDVDAMGFADPVFPVPSLEVHQHATPELRGDTWSFNFGASLEPDANDYWRKHQHPTKEVGRYILQELRAQKPAKTPLFTAGLVQELPPGSIWVSAG